MFGKANVFPKNLSPSVEKLDRYPKFGAVVARNVKHFCLYMDEDDRICFQKRAMSPSIINTFTYSGKEATVCKPFRPDDISWAKVRNRFRKPPVDSLRKNADTRIGFKIGSDYLVKQFFTFGMTKVEEGTVHVVQTLDVPVLFYLRPSDRLHPHLKRESFKQGYLPTENIVERYDRRILEPRKCYRIPPGTVYFLFNTQKNFFRLDLVDAGYEIPFEHVDPVLVRVAKIPYMYDLYDKPVATPYIDDDEEKKSPEINFDGVFDFLNDMGPPETPLPFGYDSAVTAAGYDAAVTAAGYDAAVTAAGYDAAGYDAAGYDAAVTMNPSLETRYVIFQNLPILERSTVHVSDCDCVKTFQRLKFRGTSPPPSKLQISSSVQFDEEPLDLTKKDDRVVDLTVQHVLS